VIERALAKDPAARQPSAGDLAQAGRAAVAGHGGAGPERSVARGAAATRLADEPATLERSPPPPRPPTPPPPGDDGSGRRTGMLVAVALLALALVGGGVAAALALSGGGDDGASKPAAGKPAPVTVTETASSGPTTSTTSTTEAPPTTETSGGAPVNATACRGSSGLYVGPQTSCAFAENVRRAYYKRGGGSGAIEAYSPTTGRTYDLECSEGATTVCIATTGAKVYIS
jgi:serine/threonine-protein kinase